MKIWWASELEKNYNACRLFFTKKSAIKAIIKDMESMGYYPDTTSVLGKNSTAIRFINPHVEGRPSLLWHFYHLKMG